MRVSNPQEYEETSVYKSFSKCKQVKLVEDTTNVTTVSSNLWRDFIRHCAVIQRLNPRSTIPDRIRKLRYLEDQGIDLVNFDEKQIHTLFYEMLEHGSPNTAINNYVKALNSWLKYRNLNVKFKQFKEHETPVKVPSVDDIQALLDVVSNRTMADRRDRMMIIFFCKTGLRCAELCNLKLIDIDWGNAEITVKKGKGGKDRIVPIERKVLTGITYPSLKNYIDNWRYDVGDYVFTTDKGQLTPAYVRKRIKDIAKEAGVPWMHPHCFRHFYATNLLRAGAKITVVQRLLGHSDIGTTARYLHVTESDLRFTIHNMPTLDVVRHKMTENSTRNENWRFSTKPTGEV
ncbi:MAG: tyrosine-type recombinase/integrase [Candidatus Thermoplasmatota archaeon]